MTWPNWSLDWNLDFKEFTRPHIGVQLHVCNIEIVFTSHHQELNSFRNLLATRILKSPNILYCVAFFEDTIFLERHILELGSVGRLWLMNWLLSDKALWDNFRSTNYFSALVAIRAALTRMLNKLWFVLYIYLLSSDSNLHLLLDLRLNHFDQELFVISVDSSRAIAPSTRVRPSFFSLPTITTEARDLFH